MRERLRWRAPPQGGSEGGARAAPGPPAAACTSRSRRHPGDPSRAVEARRSHARERSPARPDRPRSGRSRPRRRRAEVGQAILRGRRRPIQPPPSVAATRCRGGWTERPGPGPGRPHPPSRAAGPRRGPVAGRSSRVRPPAPASSPPAWVDVSGAAVSRRKAEARGAGARRSVALAFLSPPPGQGCLTASLRYPVKRFTRELSTAFGGCSRLGYGRFIRADTDSSTATIRSQIARDHT
jgi:hypothetical protein